MLVSHTIILGAARVVRVADAPCKSTFSDGISSRLGPRPKHRGTLEDLPEHIRTFEDETVALPLMKATELLRMEEVEKRYVLQVMHTLKGSKTQTAPALGLDRRTLYRKLKGYRLE